MFIQLTIVLLLTIFIVCMAFLVISSEDADKAYKKAKDNDALPGV